MYLWTRVQFLATDFRRLRCVSSAYANTRNQYSFFEREELFHLRNCSTICGGTDFLCPPFSRPESPVSAGFCVFPCGRGESDLPSFCRQSGKGSLFSGASMGVFVVQLIPP